MTKKKPTNQQSPSLPETKRKGRIEYFANKPQIDELLEQGYSIMAIYKHLHQQGKVTVAYATLRGYISNGPDRPFPKHGRSAKKSKAAVSRPPATSTASTNPENTSPTGFTHSSQIDDDDERLK